MPRPKKKKTPLLNNAQVHVYAGFTGFHGEPVLPLQHTHSDNGIVVADLGIKDGHERRLCLLPPGTHKTITTFWVVMGVSREARVQQIT